MTQLNIDSNDCSLLNQLNKNKESIKQMVTADEFEPNYTKLMDIEKRIFSNNCDINKFLSDNNKNFNDYKEINRDSLQLQKHNMYSNLVNYLSILFFLFFLYKIY